MRLRSVFWSSSPQWDAERGMRNCQRMWRAWRAFRMLNSEFRTGSWWRTAGNAPAWTCLQGRCITLLPRPRLRSQRSEIKAQRCGKMARRLGAAPSGWVLETRLRKLARGVF